ncbi:Retrovirus-related Pol poly from transposon [Labeo rohita]|uniref:Retrovirus-related Pol poly from transposon n=1 Tax=Labeo rohita TaxID=84645 RepID=A0A498MU02_LABRO|nr:Retrovirus-related Pol poly from transposon [Labeo rohita]
MKKSKFFQSTLKFLGHIVSEEGIQVDSEKTQAIRDFPIPPNLKSLQRFLGMAGMDTWALAIKADEFLS